MRENIKTDYLKYLFHKTLADLSRFNISHQDSEFIIKLFNKLCSSENVLIELYMLSNIKNFRTIGNYLIFIYKKMEDNVINFDNLSQNLNSDAEFIENEILNYLSNPKLIGNMNSDHYEEKSEKIEKNTYQEVETKMDETVNLSELSDKNAEDIEDDDILKFKKNYLELIQSEESDMETVFDLPTIQNKVTGQEIIDEAPANEHRESDDEQAMELPVSSRSEHAEEIDEVESVQLTEDDDDAELFIREEAADPGESEIEIKVTNDEEDETLEVEIEEDKENENVVVEAVLNSVMNNEQVEDERIPLSEDIQEELNLFKEREDIPEEDVAEEKVQPELPPTNESFIDYENKLRNKNIYLNQEFDKMINFLNLKNVDKERMLIINNIIDTTTYLETISRKMSLEIISNIYHTITLSFEKISEGKYDLSVSTLNLFKNGLSLVTSLIKGDDYFGYKDILKSIENIRNSLIEEKEKREKYLKRLQEKFELEKNPDSQNPEDSQKEILKLLKKLIKDTEAKFNMLDKITGEYQIYEALRSLSGNLNNFKEIVKLSRELQLKKLVQLAEAGYIFTKFLQNYRINPITAETKEIFGYIIYNLKSLAVGNQVEDINLFISYLNDPVKIFSKTETKK